MLVAGAGLAAFCAGRLRPAAREVGAASCCALGLFFLSYAGLGISHVADDRAARRSRSGTPPRRRSSQVFLLVGAAVLIPMILAYTGYVYWLFRGKVKAGGGYH